MTTYSEEAYKKYKENRQIFNTNTSEDILVNIQKAREIFTQIKNKYDSMAEDEILTYQAFALAEFINSLAGPTQILILGYSVPGYETPEGFNIRKLNGKRSYLCAYSSVFEHNMLEGFGHVTMKVNKTKLFESLTDECFITSLNGGLEVAPNSVDCKIFVKFSDIDLFKEQAREGIDHLKNLTFFFKNLTTDKFAWSYTIDDFYQVLKQLESLKEDFAMNRYFINTKYRNKFIEEIKHYKIKHLDKGYVKIINFMGDDVFAARFARSSYDITDRIDEKKDAGLIRRLVEDKHTSPIEACRLAFEIKTCLMVRDQHVRHRMSSINIQSLRYTKHDGDFYIPRNSRLKFQSVTNKQGSGDTLNSESSKDFNNKTKEKLSEMYDYYKSMTDFGIARELARGVLGTFFYTKMSWTIDTHNLMNYLKLRNSEEAQEEIRELAQIIELYFEFLFPNLFSGYKDFIKEASNLSSIEKNILYKTMSVLAYNLITNNKEENYYDYEKNLEERIKCLLYDTLRNQCINEQLDGSENNIIKKNTEDFENGIERHRDFHRRKFRNLIKKLNLPDYPAK